MARDLISRETNRNPNPGLLLSLTSRLTPTLPLPLPLPLSQEMWAQSLDASDWWLKTQAFARSAAVTSMVGYVIGLGDRHLDTILTLTLTLTLTRKLTLTPTHR